MNIYLIRNKRTGLWYGKHGWGYLGDAWIYQAVGFEPLDIKEDSEWVAFSEVPF